MAVPQRRDLLSPPHVPAAVAGEIAERSPRIVVVGDALVDAWLSGRARRLGRDYLSDHSTTAIVGRIRAGKR